MALNLAQKETNICKKIDEKIIGDIKQIDTYKNGRLQISFRTENKFYVLDRNGKEVEKLSFKSIVGVAQSKYGK